jgi:hypothetical protein
MLMQVGSIRRVILWSHAFRQVRGPRGSAADIEQL